MHDEFAANGFGYNVNQPSPVARFVAGAANRMPSSTIAQLRGGDGDDTIRRRGPNEPAALQTLGIERHAETVMPEDLQQVAARACRETRKHRQRADHAAGPAEPARPDRSSHGACQSHRSPARPVRPMAVRSPAQHRHDTTQQHKADITSDPYRRAIRQRHLDPTIRRCRISATCGRAGTLTPVRQILVRLLPAPAETLVRGSARSVPSRAPGGARFHNKPRLRSYRRATSTKLAPGCSSSATIRSLSSNRQRRRRSDPVIISIPTIVPLLNDALTSAVKINRPIHHRKAVLAGRIRPHSIAATRSRPNAYRGNALRRVGRIGPTHPG